MKRYRIMRYFQRDGIGPHLISYGLSLEEAQAHCNNPETSSSTCTHEMGVKRTELWGPWFDGYEEERE